MDFEVERCTRHCAASGRELAAGEEFFSVLVREGAQARRFDYSVDQWSGPPEAALGWWKSRMPALDASKRKPQLAPSEVLLQLFQELEERDDQADLRYVMSLLLVRRRILRLEETERNARQQEVLVLYAPRDESTHRVVVCQLEEARAQELQAQIGQLLFAHT